MSYKQGRKLSTATTATAVDALQLAEVPLKIDPYSRPKWPVPSHPPGRGEEVRETISALPLQEDKNVGFYKETDFKNIEHFRVPVIAIAKKKVKSLCIWLKMYHFAGIYYLQHE